MVGAFSDAALKHNHNIVVSDRDNLSKALNRQPLLLPSVYPACQSGPANE